jgi:hypothetical protein
MNPHRSIPRFAATALVVVAYLAISAISVGCGGNDNTDAGTTTIVSVFTPDAQPTDGSITMLQGATSGAAVNVRITATQFSNFFGAAFRISYDPTALLFNGMDTSTSFLREGITDTDQQLFFTSDAANSPGEIVITATRVFPAPPVPLVSATSDLVIVNFVARRTIVAGADEGKVQFADPKQVCDGSVAVPGCGSITVTAWTGGSVISQ